MEANSRSPQEETDTRRPMDHPWQEMSWFIVSLAFADHGTESYSTVDMTVKSSYNCNISHTTDQWLGKHWKITGTTPDKALGDLPFPCTA